LKYSSYLVLFIELESSLQKGQDLSF